MKNNYDERQLQIRGSILLHELILHIVLLLMAAFIQDMGIYDFVKEIGFSDFLICVICLEITFLSIELIMRDAYFGMLDQQRSVFIRSGFTILMMVLWGLNLIHLMQGKVITSVSILALLMVTTIAICMWIQYVKEKHVKES